MQTDDFERFQYRIGFDPMVNCICWDGIPIEDASKHRGSRDTDRLIATCLYLEDQGITPHVNSIEVFRRSIDFALYQPSSRKILFLYSFVADIPEKPHAFSFALEHQNSGDIQKDVASILQEVNHYKHLISGCADNYIDCVIATQEAFDYAKQSINLQSLSYFVTEDDAQDAHKNAVLAEIHAVLNRAVQSAQLPHRQAIEDKLIGPYLYQLVVMRARQGLTSARFIHVEG